MARARNRLERTFAIRNRSHKCPSFFHSLLLPHFRFSPSLSLSPNSSFLSHALTLSLSLSDKDTAIATLLEEYRYQKDELGSGNKVAADSYSPLPSTPFHLVSLLRYVLDLFSSSRGFHRHISCFPLLCLFFSVHPHSHNASTARMHTFCESYHRLPKSCLLTR